MAGAGSTTGLGRRDIAGTAFAARGGIRLEHEESPRDDPPNRFAGIRIAGQGLVVHGLLHFEAPDGFVRHRWNGLVLVDRHCEEKLNARPLQSNPKRSPEMGIQHGSDGPEHGCGDSGLCIAQFRQGIRAVGETVCANSHAAHQTQVHICQGRVLGEHQMPARVERSAAATRQYQG